MSAFLTLVRRDLRLARRDGGALGTAIGFYLMVVALMPLGIGAEARLLGRIGPGVLWIGLLLAALLSAGRMFERDHADGSLDGLVLASLPLELIALAKIVAHWLAVALPLVLVTPLLGLLLNLELSNFWALIVSMAIGTPTISAIGAIGAALTLQAHKGGLLIALLVLPLYVPTLIFGVTAVAAANDGAATAPFALLAAISLASVVLAPLAVAAALRAQA